MSETHELACPSTLSSGPKGEKSETRVEVHTWIIKWISSIEFDNLPHETLKEHL